METDKIEIQHKLERVELEKKFRLLKAPQLEKRNQIIHGLVEVEAIATIGADETVSGINMLFIYFCNNNFILYNQRRMRRL